MALCFVQLKRRWNGIIYLKKRRGRKIINHHIVEGTRESHPRVHDLQHPRLGKPRPGLQIMNTRMGFPCPFHSVVIDSITLSLDRAFASSRREVHPEGFPILTSSTWLIIYLAYFLPKPHFNHMFFGLQSIWHIYRVGKCRLTSPGDVITTCVRTHSRTSNG